MKAIGLFGGSFDPPHIGHILNITAVINSVWVDEVWLAPTGRHRFKQTMASAEHRRRMVEIMRAENFGAGAPVRIDTTELDKPDTPSTTIDLVEELQRRHSDHTFLVIIGADLIEQIPSWQRGLELLASTPFLVLPRLGCQLPDPLPNGMRVVHSNYQTDVSSSTVRDLIAKGKNLGGLIPTGVIAYIERHGLYKR
ncbi:MAG: nicotinate (nicotinamide) nucleotide adenylyltransferase [Acidobacteria bacterium]|nr:nicotinate (nicotinamide) nucleotide adenylyltransferase [Acidobacteriota bacterium]